MNFINKLYKILFSKKKSIQSVFYKNSTTKHSMNASCTLKLSTSTEQKRLEIDDKLTKLLKRYINSPEKLMQYIKMQGIKVYKLKDAEKILSWINEDEGFLTPLKGLKALYLNFILNKRVKFNTSAMFIFNTENVEIYTVARALYKYYGYKSNMPGFDYKSQELFKKLYNSRKNKSAQLSEYTISDIYACKEAIARDLESVNFTIKLSIEYERAKKALNKLKDTKSANV